METIWFWLLVVMFSGYVILDGFDFGMGMLLPFISKNLQERKLIYQQILPVWDGNEVWLIAGGGILFFLFLELMPLPLVALSCF